MSAFLVKRPVLQNAIPVPSVSSIESSRHHDGPFLLADKHTMVLIYRGVRKRKRSGYLDPAIMLQALHYKRCRLAPTSRAEARPYVVTERRGPDTILRIRFQSATFESVAKEFRCYAMIEDCDNDGREIDIYPDSLIAKRAYFECQLDSDAHFPVWDELLAAGRTREDLWVELQEQYLFKYQRFLRVECDWCSTGIWGISFPGSYGSTPNYSYEYFDLPKGLIRRFERWTAHYSSMEPCVPFDKQGFRQEWFDREGAALASEFAARVDPLTYVEYWPFVQAKAMVTKRNRS